jgi:hypothetical protein
MRDAKALHLYRELKTIFHKQYFRRKALRLYSRTMTVKTNSPTPKAWGCFCICFGFVIYLLRVK